MRGKEVQVSVVDVRGELTDIRAWKRGLSDAVDTILGISSPRMSFAGGGGSGDGVLAKVEATLDDESRGAAGVRTEAGLLDLLGSWARSFAFDRVEQVGEPLAYLLGPGILEWAERQADWAAFVSDVHDCWIRLAKITGHAPEVMARCPECKGYVLRESTDEGLTEWGVCEACGTYYCDEQAVLHAAVREMRSVAVNPQVTVTTAEALTIWPELKRDDIKNWMRSGKLTKPLQLRAVNQLANRLAEKRARDGWRRAKRTLAHRT